MSPMRQCPICSSQVKIETNLCASCAEELTSPPNLCAEQIISMSIRPTNASLLDKWGRMHPLDKRAVLGRRPQGAGVSVLESSVSRLHTEIELGDNDKWTIKDLKSTNGTKLDSTFLKDEPLHLEHKSKVTVGEVGFYFVINLLDAVDHRTTLASTTIRPEPNAKKTQEATEGEITFAGFPSTPLRFMEPTGGGGGFFEAFGKRIQLSLAQFELLRTLAERMYQEREMDVLVRGFVSSPSLLADLSWDTSRPEENHLKQLVRRLRRALDDGGFGRLIESRRGFGYRIRVTPTSPAFPKDS